MKDKRRNLRWFAAVAVMIFAVVLLTSCGKKGQNAGSLDSVTQEVQEAADDAGPDVSALDATSDGEADSSATDLTSSQANDEGSTSPGDAGSTSADAASSASAGATSSASAGAAGLFSQHGKLSVEGTQLVDAHGQPFQLHGVSTHGLAWYPQYVNEDAFRTLRDDWGANVVRFAMYTAENGGYCTGGDREKLVSTIQTGLDACTNLDMYAIIDWHILSDNDPNMHIDDAKDFWNKVSREYSSRDNVIYEICNEPNNTSWESVKTYADTIIPIIRSNDADAVIICGTPTWSQDVDLVAKNPLEHMENVMFAVHFYAATHTNYNRQKAMTALQAGTPVFISEFSFCDASGNGDIDQASTDAWKKLIDEKNLSYCGWSLSNKAETSALIKASCAKTSAWTDDELSESGKILKSWLKGE